MKRHSGSCDRHTKHVGKPRATVVRELLREGLARRAAAERRKRLAADYAAGRGDARAVLRDLESAQLALLDKFSAAARRGTPALRG